MSKQKARTRWAILFAICFALPGMASAQEDDLQNDSRQQLGNYLDKHGLSSLGEVELLRNIELAATRDSEIESVERLAEFYIGEIVGGTENREFDSRLIRLLENYPELNSSRFELLRLQATYRDNKQLFQQWIESNRDESLRIKLQLGWEKLSQRFQTVENQFQQSTDEIEQFNIQVSYLHAWTQYYWAVSTGNEAVVSGQTAKSLLQESGKKFRDLLNVADNQNLKNVDPEWLGLESIWNVRCLIGLGMVSQALGEQETASVCTQKILAFAGRQQVREEALQWRFHSFYFPGELALAVSFAEQMFANKIDSPVVWNSITLAGRMWIDPEDESAKRLTMIGLAGLARSNRMKSVEQLIRDYKIQLTSDSFYSSWIAASVVVAQYKETGNVELLMQADQLIDKALEYSQRIDDTESIANARWLSAWINYQTEEFSDAASGFRMVAETYRYKRPELASQALWMQIQMLERLSEQDQRYQMELVTATSELRRWFPESRYVKLVDFERKRRQISLLKPAEAIARLETIEPLDPNFETAQFEIVRALFRQWEENRASRSEFTSVEQASETDELESSVKSYLERFPEAKSENRVSLVLQMVSVFNELGNRNDKSAQWLAQVETETQTQIPDSVANEFHLQSMRLADQQGDRESASKHAQTLIDSDSSWPYKSAGLVYLIRGLEGRLLEASQISRGEILRELYSSYIGLTEALINQGAVAGESGNLTTATFRIGELALEIGNYQVAYEKFEELENFYPDDAQVLLGLARSGQFLGKESAIENWRMLAKGTPVGTPNWVEAKFYVASQLAQSDPGTAEKICRQTVQMAPEMTPDWQKKFTQLAAQFEERN